MIGKLLGFERKQGTYEGRDYDNWALHLVEKITAVGVTGNRVIKEKVKYSALDASALSVNSEYDIQYNRFGQIDSIERLKL